MIETPRITETRAQAAVVIHLTIRRNQMQTEMVSAMEELMAAVSDQGQNQAGPLFAHHLTLSPDMFDLEVGIPVAGPVTSVGRVTPGELPAAKVVQTVYHGPYEGLFAAWEDFGDRSRIEFGKLMEEEGLTPGQTLWERYLVGPESSADPATWQTELNLPLVEARR